MIINVVVLDKVVRDIVGVDLLVVLGLLVVVFGDLGVVVFV